MRWGKRSEASTFHLRSGQTPGLCSSHAHFCSGAL